MSDETLSVSVEEAGPNPHYRPPIMRWNRVEVVGVKGLEIGVVGDVTGDLTLVVRPTGGKWPLGQEPDPDTVHRLGDRGQNLVFVISNDERGPAVGHEFEPDATGRCRVCG
jgi:hypothetical protein